MQEIFHFVYMQNLFAMTLICITCTLMWTCFSLMFKDWVKMFSIINIPFCCVALFCVLYETVFIRNTGNYQIELRPFYTFVLAQEQIEYYRTFFMNALLFVPLGLSMPYALSKRPYKRNVFITIAFAAVLSASIEFLQYYYHLGRCETDDVIANTLGTAIGTLSYLLYMRILKNQEKGILMQKNIDDNQKLLLQLCAKSLFDKNIALPDKFNFVELIEESKRQTVFPFAYSLIKEKIDGVADKYFSQIIAKNIRVEYAHNEVHRVLSENNISYVILKGVASASYYNEPMLRTMGDVDVLVAPQDIAKADKLLKSIGFVTTDDIDSDDMHIAFKRKDGISCELHRKIGWAPKNEVGDTVLKYLSDIFEQGTEYKTSNGSCIIPNKFHHGLILLLHTATHLTHEGVGLRHLCDWAVFVNSFSNDEFINTFEKPLKETGLWRFAQLLTLCCIKYLGCDQKNWVGDEKDSLLDSIVVDILNGGNFGYKDTDRYSQIKYISDRKSGKVTKNNPILQLFSSINTKTKKEFKFVNKSKFFLPIGWIFTVCKYFYMVIVGKRSLDSAATIASAKQRKDIYNEFKLFNKE